MKIKTPKIPKPPRPPKKSALQKRIEDSSSGYWKKLADRAWSDLIHTWYISCAVNDWRCSGPLEAHHAIHRARLATRHDPKNGILLCSKHHQWSLDISAHIASLAFAEWLQINRPCQWEWACVHKYDKNPERPNYKVAMERLIRLKAEYLDKRGNKMHPHPITRNIKLEIELLPVVYQQLQSINAGNHFSINYLVNKACMRDLGIPDVPINDRTAWGIT